MTHKACRRCLLELPIEMFSKNIRSSDGKQSVCRQCAVQVVLDWEKRHPEKKIAAQKAYRLRHLESESARSIKWQKENKERVKEIKAKYRKSHPHKNIEWLNKRRARKLNAPGFSTAKQIAARVEYYGNKCYMCGGKYEHLDHVIPLSRGGSNWPANLRPSCASCNLKKHDSIPVKGVKMKINMSGTA